MKKGLMSLLSTLLLLQPLFIHSQSKPHINIPGTKDKLDTEATIQSLLQLEQIPIQNKMNEKKDYELENEILKDFRKYTKHLDTLTKQLYNIQSPFREMVGESSDADIVEASADRTAVKKDYKVKVKQIAQADSFMSASIPRNKRFSPAQFTITIGEGIYHIRFMGGTLHQLAQTIRDQSDDKIDARVINDTSETSVMQVSTAQTGLKYKMKFEGDLKPFFETELLTKSVSRAVEKTVNFQPAISFSTNRVQAGPDSITLVPESQGELGLESRMIDISNTTRFYWSVNIENKPAVTVKPKDEVKDPDMSISKMEEVTISNVTVEGDFIIPFYKKTEKTVVKTIVSNQTDIFSLIYTDGTTRTFTASSNGNFSRLMLGDSSKRVAKITFKNLNTDKSFRLYSFKFITPVEEGGLRPKNYITRAQDSIFTIDGVEIIRDKNEVEDVIDGLVIYLKKPSPSEVELKIDHDYKLVMDSLLDWVNAYNQVMEYLSILTKPNLDRTPLHKRPEKDLKNGIFSAEMSFTSLHNKLRTVVMDYYPTDEGRALGLLEQIGIYTKKAGRTDVDSDIWESTRMGLLNVDTDKLNTMLVTKFDGVKQLFINTIDGSFQGVGWSVSRVLELAISANGFIEFKIRNNENRAKQTDKAIAKLEEKLIDYETQLRIKYGKLNQTLNQTEAQKNYWNNMNKQK